MATELLLSSAPSDDPTESLARAQQETLQRAVAKVVALGAQVGLSVVQMILLLQSGMTVRELLDYLEARMEEVK